MIRILKPTQRTYQDYATSSVSVSELKLYLQLEGAAYDAQLQAYLWAAQKMVEDLCNVSLSPQVVIANFEQRSDSGVTLPFAPVDTIVTAKWRRCPLQSIDADYTQDGDVFIGEDASGDYAFPTYRVEYLTSAKVDLALTEAVKIQAGYMYQNRDEAVKGWSMVARALCNTNNY
jgi:hypothetical protein